MNMGIIQKPTIRPYSNTKRVISTPGFGDITRDRLKLIFTFLHVANYETINTIQRPKKLFKIFPVISHLNNTFQKLYPPDQDISIDKSLMLCKCHLSNSTSLSRHQHMLDLRCS
jgi:hypothetical protein